MSKYEMNVRMLGVKRARAIQRHETRVGVLAFGWGGSIVVAALSPLVGWAVLFWALLSLTALLCYATAGPE